MITTVPSPGCKALSSGMHQHVADYINPENTLKTYCRHKKSALNNSIFYLEDIGKFVKCYLNRPFSSTGPPCGFHSKLKTAVRHAPKKVGLSENSCPVLSCRPYHSHDCHGIRCTLPQLICSGRSAPLSLLSFSFSLLPHWQPCARSVVCLKRLCPFS